VLLHAFSSVIAYRYRRFNEDCCTMLMSGGTKNGLAITGAGNLPCQFIFHLSPKADIKSWKAVIGQCLAEAEKMKLTSIAMPPIGTGLYTCILCQFI
jgi:O-acetyl-ADP-ribose deacetylase (regulator of RNase III)